MNRIFMEIAKTYVCNGEVVKAYDQCPEAVTKEEIEKRCNNKEMVIVEEGGVLNCYYKEEDKYYIENAIDRVLPWERNIRDFIIFK